MRESLMGRREGLSVCTHDVHAEKRPVSYRSQCCDDGSAIDKQADSFVALVHVELPPSPLVHSRV